MFYNAALLERGIANFRNVPNYRFTMTRQERIGGDLLPAQVMEVKLRHQPLNIYMKWIAGEGVGVKGRQLLYGEGQYDNKLLIQPGGLAGRATGTLSFALDDPMVTAESRHPATDCGLLNLAQTILGHHRKDIAGGCQGFHCELHDDQVCNDRPCYLFIVEYDVPERSPTYRKVAVFIDKELSMPIAIRNYTWGDNLAPEQLDEVTLVELYSYTDIVTDTREASLGEEDFSPENPKYRMRLKMK